MHQTMMVMHLPDFRKGYRAGRLLALQSGAVPTDGELLDSLQVIAEEGEFTNEAERDTVAYTIGQLMGQISTTVIPMQADEDDTHTREYRLLREIAPDLDNEQQRALFDTIAGFWRVQDELARTLSGDLYERVLSRDAPLVLRRG